MNSDIQPGDRVRATVTKQSGKHAHSFVAKVVQTDSIERVRLHREGTTYPRYYDISTVKLTRLNQ